MNLFVTLLHFGPAVMVFLAIVGLTIVIRRRAVADHFEKDINLAAQEQWEADRQIARHKATPTDAS